MLENKSPSLFFSRHFYSLSIFYFTLFFFIQTQGFAQVFGGYYHGLQSSSVRFVDPNSEECGVEYNASCIKPKGSQLISVVTFDTTSCNDLGQKGEEYGQGMMYKQEYDTLRKYIELCAMQPKSWGEFLSIEGAIDDMDTNRFRYVDAREWFKKVLYFNPDTNYYCADVDGILHTFLYFEGRGNDQIGSLAVLKYIKDAHKCSSWYYIRNYDTLFAHTIQSVISMWRDSVKDSLRTPLDTTLPSIDELGLGILRGQNEVVSASGVMTSAICNLSLSENPFRTEAILHYHLNNNAMVRVDIYDELGRRMSGDGEGYKREGDYQIKFDAHTWSSGVYYLRLSTMGGEVRTIKLIHQ